MYQEDRVNAEIEKLIEAGVGLDEAEQMFRQSYISAALNITEGNVCAAARLLHVHRNTVNRSLAKYPQIPRQWQRKRLIRRTA